ncbi:uncharacterized protein LOC128107070 isoform X2 [Peromyscus californicus insignis]|uniref:uncharacterized protein LOC128107070 isoform X2 n=1 Tax=Peromyscus californicus insignis TaxID=564181 RepID=UPI0022A7E329|nr:uncharacterized protein LOC128107070 isoform X2 [Peromyscus californicus insignis]
MKGEHECMRTFKTPFLIPDYFLHVVSQAPEHLWPLVTDPNLGVRTTLLILHSTERGVGAGTIIYLSKSEHMAKATLGTRIRKGKGFKNGPWPPEQSHRVQGRLGNSGGAPGKPAFESAAARRTGCRGGRRLRRRGRSNPLSAGRLRPPQAARPRAPARSGGRQRSPAIRVGPAPPRTGLPPPPRSSQASTKARLCKCEDDDKNQIRAMNVGGQRGKQNSWTQYSCCLSM